MKTKSSPAFSRRFLFPWVLFVSLGILQCSAVGNENMARKKALVSIRSDDLASHVDVLADDSFEGREAGKRGGRAAANYLAQYFRKLRPAGTRGVFQGFGAGYRNILGVLSGSDDRLQNEYILIGAHYDHVGYGTRQNSNGPVGYIHNGADDNASGTAAVLELIDAFQNMNLTPNRSIIFALWDGEEKGLLGSEHWTAHPTLPIDNIKLAINLDMIGRLNENKVEVIGSRTGVGLRQLTARANRSTLLHLDYTWGLEDNSDHYPMFQKQIPVLMFHTGLHADYHTPRDDSHLVNHDGIQQITRLVFSVIHEAANVPTSPRYRFAAKNETERRREQFEKPLPQPAPRLQLHWKSLVRGDQIILKTVSVTAGGPAQRGGIRPGDELVSINGRTISNTRSLIGWIQSSPKDAVIQVRRASDLDNMIDLPITLNGEPIRIGISWRVNDAEKGTVTLVRIVKNSIADAAGLRVGDRISAVNDQGFANSDEFLKIVRAEPLPHRYRMERQGIISEVEVQPRPIGADDSPSTDPKSGR